MSASLPIFKSVAKVLPDAPLAPIVTVCPETEIVAVPEAVNVKFSPMATPDWVEPSVIPNPNCLKLALSPSPKYNLDELDAV